MSKAKEIEEVRVRVKVRVRIRGSVRVRVRVRARVRVRVRESVRIRVRVRVNHSLPGSSHFPTRVFVFFVSTAVEQNITWENAGRRKGEG